MSKLKPNKKSIETTWPKPGIKTNLPGVDSNQVIPSEPDYIREDRYTPSNPKKYLEKDLR